MECQRQYTAPVLADRLVVDLHVVIERLLVAEVEVVLHVVVGHSAMRCLFFRLLWPLSRYNVRFRSTCVFLNWLVNALLALL